MTSPASVTSIFVAGNGYSSYIVVTEGATTSTTATSTPDATSNSSNDSAGSSTDDTLKIVLPVVFLALILVIVGWMRWHRYRKSTQIEREDQPYGPQADAHESGYQRQPAGRVEMGGEREAEELDSRSAVPEMQTTPEVRELDSAQRRPLFEAPSSIVR